MIYGDKTLSIIFTYLAGDLEFLIVVLLAVGN